MKLDDENIYHEYANWKLENNDLLEVILKSEANAVSRLHHIIKVVEFLYDRLVEDDNYGETEDNIFRIGFFYLADVIGELKQALGYYNEAEDIALKKYDREINLLLNTIDFQNELLNQEQFDDEDYEILKNFELTVLKKMEKKETIPNEMYKQLDEISLQLFQKLNIDYYPISNIFLEIADELGIVE